MRYFIIAGEASGDLHGSNLVKELRKRDPRAECRGWGGDLMQEAGVTISQHYRDTAFMGFFEVIANLRTILGLFRKAKADLLAFRPDVLILIDYPGFNLRMAGFAHRNGIRVCYYISPKVWAWKTSRVKKIKQTVDQMFVILPFEEEFYRRFDYQVYYEGNPLLDSIREYESTAPTLKTFCHENQLGSKPLIGLIPGSRLQEVKRNLPVMLAIVRDFPDYQFVIAGFAALDPSVYREILGSREIPVLVGQTRAIMKHARAAVVTSGTATLETALLKTPQVVCYKAQPASFFLARFLVSVRYISLVNLIMDRTVVTELLQQEMNPQRLKDELGRLLHDPESRNRMLEDYEELAFRLGEPGVPGRIADSVLKALK